MDLKSELVDLDATLELELAERHEVSRVTIESSSLARPRMRIMDLAMSDDIFSMTGKGTWHFLKD